MYEVCILYTKPFIVSISICTPSWYNKRDIVYCSSLSFSTARFKIEAAALSIVSTDQ